MTIRFVINASTQGKDESHDEHLETELLFETLTPELEGDPEALVRQAIHEWLLADDEAAKPEDRITDFNWGNVDEIPAAHWMRFGVRVVAPETVATYYVDYDEDLLAYREQG